MDKKQLRQDLQKIFHLVQWNLPKLQVNTALKMSNHNPKDIDVAEIHDAFSVCEPMALESLGSYSTWFWN